MLMNTRLMCEFYLQSGFDLFPHLIDACARFSTVSQSSLHIALSSLEPTADPCIFLNYVSCCFIFGKFT